MTLADNMASVFKKNEVAEKKVKNEKGSIYSLISCSDLTPGSLEVWLDLPTDIKFDPALAPFRHKYEQHHGKLDSNEVRADEEGTVHERLPVAPNTQNNTNGDRSEVLGSRLMIPLSTNEDKNVKSVRKKRLEQTLRIIKLTALVAGWVILTATLLLTSEKTHEELQAAVQPGETKGYPLLHSAGRVTVLVKLTGAFALPLTNHSAAPDRLLVWLSRSADSQNSQDHQNSTPWSLRLQPSGAEFFQSVTEVRTLVLDSTQNNETQVLLRFSTTGDTPTPITITYQINPLDERDGIIYSTILLLTLYILIIFEIVNRSIGALLCSSLGAATLAVVGERPSLPELVSWLDVETLLLLFSMMVLVAILADTGLFDYLAVLAFEVTGGRTWPLINCLCFFTAFFSTFLDNVTTVLLMTPVTIRLCEVKQLNPIPVLMSMVIFSNVGGAATPVGDPPNVIIASHPAILNENINFTNFTLHMGLGIILVAVQTYFQLRYMFRDMSKLGHSVPVEIQEMRQELAAWRRAAASLSSYSRDEDIVRKALEKKVKKLNQSLLKKEASAGASKSDPNFRSTLARLKAKYRIRDKPLLIKSTICVSFVIIVFFLHAFPELQRLTLGWTAFLGALLLLLLSELEDLEPVLARIEWSTLLFFTALFVLMEALAKLGLISWIGNITESIILSVGEESRLAVAIMLVLWVSGLASAFVDNIPLTTMMVRVIARLADKGGLGLPLAPLAWALSLGACLGGNGTLIGASANVVCAGVAEQHGYRISFTQFFKIGFPIMIGHLLVSSVYLLVCHCLFTWH